MNYRERAVIEKMRRLLRLTGGVDMLASDFYRASRFSGDLHSWEEIEAVGYNPSSIWCSIIYFMERDRYFYRAPEGGNWPSEGMICWKSDFLRDHADMITFDPKQANDEPVRVLEALEVIRTDGRFRRTFLDPWNRWKRARGATDRLSPESMFRFNRRRDRWDIEALMEAAEDCGIVEEIGDNPQGLLGHVWRYNQARHEGLMPLIYTPIEAYLARPHRQLELVWNADQQCVGA